MSGKKVVLDNNVSFNIQDDLLSLDINSLPEDYINLKNVVTTLDKDANKQLDPLEGSNFFDSDLIDPHARNQYLELLQKAYVKVGESKLIPGLQVAKSGTCYKIGKDNRYEINIQSLSYEPNLQMAAFKSDDSQDFYLNINEGNRILVDDSWMPDSNHIKELQEIFDQIGRVKEEFRKISQEIGQIKLEDQSARPMEGHIYAEMKERLEKNNQAQINHNLLDEIKRIKLMEVAKEEEDLRKKEIIAYIRLKYLNLLQEYR